MMNLLYINVAELVVVLTATVVLLISKYYIKKSVVDYAIYVICIYFVIVLAKFMIINKLYLDYVILFQYYLYLFAVYLIYKKTNEYFGNKWNPMFMAVSLTVFLLMPVLLCYYFGFSIIYFLGKTLYALFAIALSVKMSLSSEVNMSKRVLGLAVITSSVCLIFVNLLSSNSPKNDLTYLLMVAFELIATVLIVNAGHLYLKIEMDKRNRIYESVYNNSTDAIVVLYYETIEECNEKALEVFKTSRKNLIGNSIITWSREVQEKGKSAYECFYQMLEKVKHEDIVGVDWTFRNSDIEELASEISIFELGNNRYAVLIRDMNYKYVDESTGFTKREYLRNRLDQSLRNVPEKVALLALNIDDFKSINDEFGFAFGDKVLEIVADRLREAFSGNSISRIGGDEFIILAENIDFLNELYIYIEKIKNIFARPVKVNNNILALTACIGVLYNSEGDTNAGEIMNNVDFILNVAKKSGRGCVEFYSNVHKAEFADRINTERDMKQAILDVEFVPFYQPIVSSDSEDIIGAEALVRWVKADGTIMYPDSFIKTAEENGLIVDIDYLMLEQACKHCRELIEIYPDFVVHVNMSAYHFADEKIVAVIRKNLDLYSLEGRHLVVEVTETLFVKELVKISGIIDKIREMGVLVALDDFGTGYSSLSYLSAMNVDIVKIDRIFVMNIPYDEKAKALIEFIILLNKTFKFEVVVEGVEEREQVDYLKWLTIDYIQGYYYYKPVEYNTVKRLLENIYGL